MRVRLTAAELRCLVHLLDLLCEHEESVIDSHTLGGEIDRRDREAALIVLRSRRIWRSAQNEIVKLESAAG